MANDKKTMVFGYVRVSTENQLENYSIDEQVQRITSYCRAKGWVLLKIYTDGGFSGGNINRPALQQMLSAIRDGKASTVVVYKLDRLSRSQKDTLTLIEDEFLSNNVDFVSINENFDTSSPFGRAMIGILSVFAQLEKDQITERFTMGRIGRSKAGYFHGGGNIPLGYNYEDGNLVINEYTAIQIKQIYNLFLGGKSINAIWHIMEKQYNGKWSASKIRIILTNSLYIGKVKFAGTEYDGKHQPIISSEIYNSANKLLFSSERECKKTTSQKTPFRASFLLSSLIVCSRCGARYSGNHGFYKCYSRSKSSKKFIKDPSCMNSNWVIDELDAAVVSEIRQLLGNTALFELAVASTENSEITIDKKAVQKEIKYTENQIERLIDLYQVGAIPMNILTTRVNELSDKKTALEAQLNKNIETPNDKRKIFAENIQRFASSFDTSPLETKRLLISSLVEAVVIDGDDFNIKWRV
ncbi:MAG: recombinase family protein [Christensenella sp.]